MTITVSPSWRDRVSAIFAWLVALGVFVCCCVLLTYLWNHWRTTSWLVTVSGVYLFGSILSIALGGLLVPFARYRVIKLLLRSIYPIIQLVLIPGYYLAPFLGMVLTTGLVWFAAALVCVALHALGLIPPLTWGLFLYLTVLLTAIVLVYWSYPLVSFYLHGWNKNAGDNDLWLEPFRRKLNHDHLLRFFRADAMSGLVYALLLVATVVDNMEVFSGTTIIQHQWWAVYKSIPLQVLITLVAIDAVLAKFTEARRHSGMQNVQ